MPAYKYSSLTIAGFGDRPVPNSFLRQEEPASVLAVEYPGLNYTCDMPLLYYPANLLLQRGADVLQVKTDYTGAAFQALPAEERLRCVYGDASAALQAGRVQRKYSQVVLIGKSIGTLALAALFSSGAAQEALAIWLTPLLRQPFLVEAALTAKAPALFVVGTADHTYDAAALERILAANSANGAEALYVEGGDHRLEVEGDTFRSLRNMDEILRGVERFLARHSG